MATIEHASAYAHDPEEAAKHLAALCGGSATTFSPLAGAWVCHFGKSGSGPFLELYPRTARFALHDGEIRFETMRAPATGAGTHLVPVRPGCATGTA